jgi:UDP-N-acetylglucosamine 2-epimerase
MRQRRNVVLVVGTRPEAIKLARVYHELKASRSLAPRLVLSGQHTDLLSPLLKSLKLQPDARLSLPSRNRSPNDVAAEILRQLPSVLKRLDPAAVLVQGDTTTVVASALAAYHMRVPVGHVEAGLRTYNHAHPFPEEANRQLMARLATWCFAPTNRAVTNLLRERVDRKTVFLTGNTVVDSLTWMINQLRLTSQAEPILLLTLHRRESFGQPLVEILSGVCDFLNATPEARAVWPVHPNPNVRTASRRFTAHCRQLTVVEPLDYPDFVRTLASCRIVLTDSGGVQEEAPSFGKSALVAREITERPEAATQRRRNRIVGRDRKQVTKALFRVWAEKPYEGRIPVANPYGDGRAATRIRAVLESALTTNV